MRTPQRGLRVLRLGAHLIEAQRHAECLELGEHLRQPLGSSHPQPLQLGVQFRIVAARAVAQQMHLRAVLDGAEFDPAQHPHADPPACLAGLVETGERVMIGQRDHIETGALRVEHQPGGAVRAVRDPGMGV